MRNIKEPKHTDNPTIVFTSAHSATIEKMIMARTPNTIIFS